MIDADTEIMTKHIHQKAHAKDRLPSSPMVFLVAAVLMGTSISARAIPELAPPSKAEKPKASEQRNIPGEKATADEDPDDDFWIENWIGIDKDKRLIPGTGKVTQGGTGWVDSNPDSGLKPVDAPDPHVRSDFLPTPDRWRLAKDLNLVNESIWDPYNRNPLKGDNPVFDDWFVNVLGISDSLFEAREIPTPVSSQVSAPNLDNNGQLDLLGRGSQLMFNQNLILSIDMYKGDTVFMPPEWEFRVTPVINYNYTHAQEYGFLNVDPRRGEDRSIYWVGLQESFVDYHIQDVSSRYDFDSIRVGIQPMNVDFRGFLFLDNALGVRLFGNRDDNRWQYNVAWFRRLEKNINNGLNDITQAPRNDDVYLVNVFRQDFPFRGFTSQLAGIYNMNREGNNPNYYDQNGFPQRPALIGTNQTRNYDIGYVGYNGDGHFDRFNLTTSWYYAAGTENRSTFTGKPADVSAWFTATEGSVDFDWNRIRISAIHASGDNNPYDGIDQGFDAILENPQIAGADTSFWIRQAVPLIGGGSVAVAGQNGLLPDLRSSKILGQSNFTNPGLNLFGIGTDHEILPELRLSTNVNYLSFDNTSSLQAARNQGSIPSSIGWDVSAAVIYRPLFSQNVVTRFSGATLVPGDGVKALYGDRMLYSFLCDVILTY